MARNKSRLIRADLDFCRWADKLNYGFSELPIFSFYKSVASKPSMPFFTRRLAENKDIIERLITDNKLLKEVERLIKHGKS